MPSNLNLDYYYGSEMDQYSFYRIPKILLDEMDRYRELIKENIDYDLLLTEHPYDEETLEGYSGGPGGCPGNNRGLHILTGGERAMAYKGKIAVSDMAEGLRCLENMGRLLGRDNRIYRHAIQGINEAMNTDIEDALSDDRVFECFTAEAVIQNLKAGAYVDPTDVRLHFKEEHFRNIILAQCEKHGIR